MVTSASKLAMRFSSLCNASGVNVGTVAIAVSYDGGARDGIGSGNGVGGDGVAAGIVIV
jgi:hypothetical protein